MSVAILNANRSPGVLDESTYRRLNTNSGNYYIAYALAKMLGLGEEALVNDTVWCPFPEDAALPDRVAGADAILLPLQDQVRTSFPDEEYENALALLRGLEPDGAPMIAVSLGANSFEGYDPDLWSKLSPTRVHFFQYLSERCLSIGVRGPYSAEVLAKIGVHNVEVVGCPSYFETGPERQIVPAASRPDGRIGATGVFRTHLSEPLTVLQGDADWPLVKLLHQLEEPLRPADVDAIASFPPHRTLLGDLRPNRVYFGSDPETWKRRLRSECLLAVGTRLHGAIVALNAGIPAIVTNGDARARESCEYFGIPWLPNSCDWSTSLEALCDMADVGPLNALYDKRYAHFATWMARVGLPLTSPMATRLPSLEMARATDIVIEQRVEAVRSRCVTMEVERAVRAEERASDAERRSADAEKRALAAERAAAELNSRISDFASKLSEAQQRTDILIAQVLAYSVELSEHAARRTVEEKRAEELERRIAASRALSSAQAASHAQSIDAANERLSEAQAELEERERRIAASEAQAKAQAASHARSIKTWSESLNEAQAELDGLKRHWVVRLTGARAPLTPLQPGRLEVGTSDVDVAR